MSVTSSTSATGPPNSVLWAPLPLISWLLPGVGHVAVSDSLGNIHDFAGSYLININNMMCGPPARYWPLPLWISWDEAVAHGNELFGTKEHSLIWQNCHSHVTCCINAAAPEMAMSPWKLYWTLLVRGKPLGRKAWWRTWGGFISCYSVLLLVWLWL